jgi:N-acetylglucosamine kinase-like BadF-type ATPase
MPEYALGVDGGGTKTDYLLFDTGGNMVARLRGAGTNHEGMPGGMAELEERLNGILPPFLRENGLEPRDVSGAVFGMAGVDVPSQKEALEAIYRRMGFRNICVMNDSFIGIKAGSPKGYGICVVNGTGNTIGGIDRAGRWLQIAGTGYIACEDGGSGRIAAQALRAVYEEMLCLGAATAMTPLVLRLLGVSEPAGYMEAVYAKYYTGAVEARDILDILFLCANRGDEAAAGILRRVGGQMARCVAGCERLLDFGDEVDVVLVGSVTLKASCPILLDTLKSEALRLTGKKLNFIPLAVPVAAGAVLWAIELALGRPAGKDVVDRVISAVSEA